MPLSKSDIDALVDGMDQGGGRSVFIDWEGCVSSIPVKDMRRALYLAAGLTAEGERKPERVRAYLHRHGDGCLTVSELSCPNAVRSYIGWFVPDGDDGSSFASAPHPTGHP